jgi:hypothetical protein
MLFMGLTVSFPAYAQEINEFDYHEPDSEVQLPSLAKGETLNAENGLVHTPQGELKVLMIYAQFVGDNLYPTSDSWKVDSLPNYNEVFYSSVNQFNTSNTDQSLSNFYYQMSKFSANPFKIYGETFPEVIPVPVPTTTPVSFGTFTTQIFEYIEANYPDFDWASFDNRTNYPSW